MSQHGYRRLAASLAASLFALATLAASPHADAAATDDRTIAHVLSRIGFGPRPGDIERVRRTGLKRYIDEQLDPARIADNEVEARLSGFRTLTMSSAQIAREYFIPAQIARREQQRQAPPGTSPNPPAAGMPPGAAPQRPSDEMRRQRDVLAEVAQQKILRAVYSERQLQEVLVDFWFNHFNVFAGKGVDRILITEYEREAIRPHVLGRFRDLLEATAKSPAMLFYLDNWLSADPNGPHVDPRARIRPPLLPRTMPVQQTQMKRGLNENYARELLELHTLGVDGGYTQRDIVEVARAFTGWTMRRPGPQMDRALPRLARANGGDPDGLFFFDPRTHDPGEKIVLGRTIKAGGGIDDGRQVLDILARHPSTATFVSTKLARRFVSDDPPAALVRRAAARFRETDGDIREVVRTIVTSREFLAAEAYRAKMKTPFEYVVSALRATRADVSNAMPVAQTLQQLGQPLYMCEPPTGYSDKAEGWVNSGALINRMNFAVALAGGRVRGITVDAAALLGFDPRADLGRTRAALVASLLGGEVSASTRATIERAADPAQAAALTLGSPEFQRR